MDDAGFLNLAEKIFWSYHYPDFMRVIEKIYGDEGFVVRTDIKRSIAFIEVALRYAHEISPDSPIKAFYSLTPGQFPRNITVREAPPKPETDAFTKKQLEKAPVKEPNYIMMTAKEHDPSIVEDLKKSLNLKTADQILFPPKKRGRPKKKPE